MSKQSNLLIIAGIGIGGFYLLTRKKSVTGSSSNITATAFPTPTIPAGLYNTVDIDITWTNTGGTSGSFIPQIKIGAGTPINLDVSTTLAPGAVYHKTMRLTGVTAGSQSICPVPS